MMPESTEARPPSRNSTHRSMAGRLIRGLAGVTVGASLLATIVLIGLPFLGRSLDHRTVIVTTGSMTPTIDPGDAIVLEEASSDEIDVGDAITYGTSEGLVTHRVVAVRTIDGETWFQTKGDANEFPDPDLTPAAAVEGRVRWTVPRIGSWMVTALSRWGTVVLMGIPALLLFVQEAMTLRSTWRRPARRPTRRWTRSAATG